MAACAQAAPVKLYGYAQVVIPGAAPRGDIAEGGQRLPAADYRRWNYFIYLDNGSGKRVYPLELWIGGKRQGVTFTEVDSTPVTQVNRNITRNPRTVTLVPKTTGKVLQLTPATEPEKKATARAARLATENELVLVYRMGGKTHYRVVQKMERLEPLALP